jgi:hypothetical protein
LNVIYEAELMKLRYFVGMSSYEAANAVCIDVPTAKQWRAYPRAWLAIALREKLPH